MSFTTKAPVAPALRLHWNDIMVVLYEVMFLLIFWLCYSYVVAAAMAAASAGRKAVMAASQPERRNVCVVPMALSSLLLSLAHTWVSTLGLAKSEIQRNNWHCEWDQQYN